MCGLVGLYNSSQKEDSGKLILQNMADAIMHRGPDDKGIWFEPNIGLGFGHRRLAIQDLSLAGHQPMISNSGRYTIVFNGEIYNHLEIRSLLKDEGINFWKGHSDTETLLAGFEAWGIKKTIIKSKGMFAFAIHDSKSNQLILGRDRLGEKPLYYGWQSNSFIFGSELKALKTHPDFSNTIDRGALTQYLKFNYVPGTNCIYKDINKLEPGCLLTMSLYDKKVKVENYWSLRDVIHSAKQDLYSGDESEAINALEVLLKNSVKNQMISDVPLGAFLSGGVDSSTIVALMQSQSDIPINTFSIGFDIEGFNEAEHAKAVAKHLGTNHKELYVNSDMAIDVIEQLPKLYDEPFADSSQIPTYLVSRMAKNHVTVALSGDAGDELFCGYNRYLATQKTWSRIKYLPLSIRSILATFIRVISESTWDKIFSIMPFGSNWSHIGQKLYKASIALKARNINELHDNLISQWNKPEEVVIGSKYNNCMDNNLFDDLGLCDVEYMMAKDTYGYLVDDILVKVDRAAMGVSLETRVPMLDHEVLQYAWSLPINLKLKDGVTKWPLREILYRFVPRSLIERPKVGFSIPLDEWLRGPLMPWADRLLNSDLIERQGFFHHQPIIKKWEEHKSGQYNWSSHLWSILIFQSWLEKQGNIK